MARKKALQLLDMTPLCDAAECLKVLAHPVRLRIVEILLQGSFTVGEISDLCALPAHQTSEHLRLMQGRGLLTSERKGRRVFYKVESPTLPEIMACIRRHCRLSP